MNGLVREVLQDGVKQIFHYWMRTGLVQEEYRLVFIRTDKRTKWTIRCPEDEPGFNDAAARERYENYSDEEKQERDWAIILFLTFTELFNAQSVTAQNEMVTWIFECYPQIIRLYGCLP
ncbi:MAG: hypothetical protein ACXADB_06690 [Candidatus Hermodarchaeia archaeon]|jgi:hypothetical protein